MRDPAWERIRGGIRRKTVDWWLEPSPILIITFEIPFSEDSWLVYVEQRIHEADLDNLYPEGYRWLMDKMVSELEWRLNTYLTKGKHGEEVL